MKDGAGWATLYPDGRDDVEMMMRETIRWGSLGIHPTPLRELYGFTPPFDRKRSANPPLRVGANQAKADFFQFHGRSSWSFLLGHVGSFSSISQR